VLYPLAGFYFLNFEKTWIFIKCHHSTILKCRKIMTSNQRLSKNTCTDKFILTISHKHQDIKKLLKKLQISCITCLIFTCNIKEFQTFTRLQIKNIFFITWNNICQLFPKFHKLKLHFKQAVLESFKCV
jgi:hypothetical protein